MKKFCGVLAAILTLFIVQTGVIAAESLKVGIVDLQRCIRESSEGQKMQEKLQNKQRKIQEELDKRQNDLNTMKTELEKQSLMLSMDAKEDKQQEFEKKQRELGYFYQDMNDELKKAENEAKNELLNTLMTVVDKIAKRDKYDIIAERTGGSLLFVSPALDVTDEIIKELNSSKP